MSHTVAVLSPHLDDAVLGAWSALVGDGEVRVVNVFAGVPEPGPLPRWDRMAGASDRVAHMHHRLDEDRAALAMAGRSPTCLSFLDEHYRAAPPDTDEIRDAIEEVVLDTAELWAPCGVGGHADHLLVRAAAFELRQALGASLTLYAELPYAARFGWPSWVSGKSSSTDSAAQLAIEQASGDLDLEPEVRRLDPSQRARKLEAMRLYRTQFPLLNQGPLGLLEHPLVLPFEVTWSA